MFACRIGQNPEIKYPCTKIYAFPQSTRHLLTTKTDETVVDCTSNICQSNTDEKSSLISCHSLEVSHIFTANLSSY